VDATPRAFCVNAVDKGLTVLIGVPLGLARGKKAVDTPRLRSGQEGLSRQRVDSEQWVVSLSALALRDGLQELTECENTPSCGMKEGRNGDTVSRTLSYIYRIRYCLSSNKLRAVK
jgi:hypothetical protein